MSIIIDLKLRIKIKVAPELSLQKIQTFKAEMKAMYSILYILQMYEHTTPSLVEFLTTYRYKKMRTIDNTPSVYLSKQLHGHYMLSTETRLKKAGFEKCRSRLRNCKIHKFRNNLAFGCL